tara:strand:- start:937 stop:1149 length:213 start_codon:yes stop_codon:yes gene_type:complete
MKLILLMKFIKNIFSKETTQQIVGEVSDGLKQKRIIKMKYKIAVLIIIAVLLICGVIPKEMVIQLIDIMI